jgi:hypothetical protein
MAVAVPKDSNKNFHLFFMQGFDFESDDEVIY